MNIGYLKCIYIYLQLLHKVQFIADISNLFQDTCI